MTHTKEDYHDYDKEPFDQRNTEYVDFEKSKCTDCGLIVTPENSNLFCVNEDGETWWEYHQCNVCFGYMCKRCGEWYGMVCDNCR